MRASGSTQRKVAVPAWSRSGRTSRRRSGLQSSAGSSRPSARSRGPSRSAPCGRSRAARRRDPGTGRSSPRRASPARAAWARAARGRSASRSSSVPTIPPHGSPRSSARQPERIEHRLAQVLLERHAGVARELVREQVEAAVRVDPRASGRREAVAVRPRTAGRTRARAGGAPSSPRAPPARRGRSSPPRPRRAPRGRRRASSPRRASTSRSASPRVASVRRRIGHAGRGVRHAPRTRSGAGPPRRRY